MSEPREPARDHGGPEVTRIWVTPEMAAAALTRGLLGLIDETEKARQAEWRKVARQHRNAADSALLADPAARLRIIREGLGERLPGPDSDPHVWLAWAERRATTGELMRYHAMATDSPDVFKVADDIVRRAHAIMRELRDLLGLPEGWQSRPINLPGHGDAEG